MVIYHVLFLRCYIIITFWHFVHTNINIYSNAPTAPSPVDAKTKLLCFHCIHYITLQDTINSVRIRESLLFNLLSTFESHLLSPAKFRPHGVQYSQFNSYIFFLWHRTTDQQPPHQEAKYKRSKCAIGRNTWRTNFPLRSSDSIDLIYQIAWFVYSPLLVAIFPGSGRLGGRFISATTLPRILFTWKFELVTQSHLTHLWNAAGKNVLQIVWRYCGGALIQVPTCDRSNSGTGKIVSGSSQPPLAWTRTIPDWPASLL